MIPTPTHDSHSRTRRQKKKFAEIPRGIPVLDTVRADSHKSCPIRWGTWRPTTLFLRISHVRQNTKRHIPYNVGCIRDSRTQFLSGLQGTGVLLKAAVQICLEDLLVRTPRNGLLAHNIRSMDKREYLQTPNSPSHTPSPVKETILCLTSYDISSPRPLFPSLWICTSGTRTPLVWIIVFAAVARRNVLLDNAAFFRALPCRNHSGEGDGDELMACGVAEIVD